MKPNAVISIFMSQNSLALNQATVRFGTLLLNLKLVVKHYVLHKSSISFFVVTHCKEPLLHPMSSTTYTVTSSSFESQISKVLAFSELWASIQRVAKATDDWRQLNILKKVWFSIKYSRKLQLIGICFAQCKSGRDCNSSWARTKTLRYR